ncbi:BnaCnng48580D [Brassica napus]|uniref:BnaCnng48580D protein n=1 Tax=Brassica napus TaxID=3708 RepID=A0A078JIZ8_BRANA|nr:BnaCnng48580D [Brassica napus]
MNNSEKEVKTEADSSSSDHPCPLALVTASNVRKATQCRERRPPTSPSQKQFMKLKLAHDSLIRGRQYLSVPFMRANGMTKPGLITLVGKDGVKWKVNLKEEGSGSALCLGTGWKEFAKANGLKTGDYFTLESAWKNEIPMLSLVNTESASDRKERGESSKAMEKERSTDTSSIVQNRVVTLALETKDVKACTLTIPVAFLKHIEGTNEHHKAKMRSDASKITWEVKIENGRRLTNGWKEFALAHDLRIGDILIFRQEKDMAFHVTLLGPSGCEIQYESCSEEKNNIGEFCVLSPSCFVAYVSPATLRHDKLNLPRSFVRANGLEKRCGDIVVMNEKSKSWTLALKQELCRNKPKNKFFRQNRKINFLIETKTEFSHRNRKIEFSHQNRKTEFSRQNKNEFSRRNRKTEFPAKNEKPNCSRQNRKQVSRQNLTNFPAKTVKTSFSAKTAKTSFSAKTRKIIFPANHKNLFSRRNRKTEFSRQNRKIEFFRQNKNEFSRRNRKTEFFRQKRKIEFSRQKRKIEFSRQNRKTDKNRKTEFFRQKFAKRLFPPKSKTGFPPKLTNFPAKTVKTSFFRQNCKNETYENSTENMDQPNQTWRIVCEANGLKLGKSFTLEIINEHDKAAPVFNWVITLFSPRIEVYSSRDSELLKFMRMPNKRFFKPLLPGFHSHLTIPVAFFLKYIEGTNEHHTAKLRSDASKITWEVKIEDGQKLTDGWKEFAIAHDLRIGDILMFRQEKDMAFHVTLLGPSGCEFQYESCSEEENNLGRNIPKKKNLEREAESSSLDPSCFLATIWPSSLRYDTLNLPRSFVRSNGLETRCGGEIVLMNEKGKSWTLALKQKLSGSTYIRRGWRRFCSANVLKTGGVYTFKLIHSGRTPVLRLFFTESESESEERNVEKIQRKKAESSSLDPSSFVANNPTSTWKASSSQSQNRFLTLALKPFNLEKYILYFPVRFSRSHGINEEAKMTLLDKNGVKWSTDLRSEETSDRIRLVGGWQEFFKTNCMKPGESIIVKLIWEGDKSCVLKFCSKVKNETK